MKSPTSTTSVSSIDRELVLLALTISNHNSWRLGLSTTPATVHSYQAFGNPSFDLSVQKTGETSSMHRVSSLRSSTTLLAAERASDLLDCTCLVIAAGTEAILGSFQIYLTWEYQLRASVLDVSTLGEIGCSA
ncbi:hypothetical protein PM082_002307 [Marasmius tenuissimus]|nr:hypothetical protein PM082_002307 [Marasmius tenuissimus]